ncbi:MAG: pyridoxamine 5'-phosphate oxidase family protein, partial [Pseudomonadales bacterium]|nr:pyridoxamine 5'-phosphate oxidase family protein [Pseudomonadales bacterium]
DSLTGRARDIVAQADTFFVASLTGKETGFVAGADVSHRGGLPGFVQIDDDYTITVPDYRGNFFFNTLGNFLINPQAGLLFVDFETGDMLMLSGDVELLLDDLVPDNEPDMGRRWRFRLRKGNLLRHASPWVWDFLQTSASFTAMA